MKTAVRNLLSLLVVLGLVIALWPLGQTAYARWSQDRLQDEWRQQAAVGGTGANVKLSAAKSAAKPAKQGKPAPRKAKRVIRPWPATRIIAPEAEVDAVVVQGMDEASLRRGPGHAVDSALPGEPGNCIISGHRNVYGSHFYKIDALMPGSEITLSTPKGDFTYQVLMTYSVTDNDTSPYKPLDPDIPQLTIITCTLPHTVQRIIIVAQMLPQ